MDEPLMPMPNAGRYLGYTGKSSGKTSIYKHCAEGRLTKVRLGRRSFITRESAERLIRQSVQDSPSADALKEAK